METKLLVFNLILSCALYVRAKTEVEYDYGTNDNDGPPPRLEDVPDKYYDDLMKEVPRLGQVYAEFNARRNSPAYKFLQQKADNPDKPHILSSNASKQSGRRVFQNYPYDYTTYNWNISRSGNYVTQKVLYQNKKHDPRANCYWCGMNVSFFVPTTSLCHDAFESQDFRMRAMQRFLRGKCYHTNPIFINFGGVYWWIDMKYFGSFQGWNNMIYGAYYASPANDSDKKYKGKWGWGFYWDYGLKRNFFGQYTGGCFKRYLDVGNIYTQRGCRHYWPINTYGASPTHHRFKKLEYVLRWKDEGCVSSTHASLTPFNRGISLYARYHVCVCAKRYCNGGEKRARHNIMLLAVAILFTCTSFFYLNKNSYLFR